MDRYTLATGIELDVQDTGPKDAPALFFLHGFPESHRTWRHQISHFSARYRCVAPDQRGYRGSSKPQEVAAYTPDKLIGDIFGLADAMGIERFTIVGHDWGGAISWGAALLGQASGRVPRVAIMNAPHPAIFQKLLYTNPEQRAASQYMRAFRDPANDELVREHGLGAIIAKAVGWAASPGMEPEYRDELLADWQNREAAFGMLNWYRATPVVVPPADAPLEASADTQHPELPRLTIPTLVIWAMEDRALPPANLQGLDEQVENLTLVEVPGCGHFVQWERPEVVNRALEQWLEQTEEPAD